MSFKKLMSAVIAVAMLVSFMGITAFAEELEIPGCTVAALTELENISAVNIDGEEMVLNLDFGRVFTAEEVFDASLKQSDLYEYLVDFEIVFSNDTTAKLAGWYEWVDSYTNGNWVALCTNGKPLEIGDGVINKYGYTFKANSPVKIMETAGLGNGLKYEDILKFVKEFKCGVELAPSTLDGVVIDLALCMYDPETKEVVAKVSSERFIYDNPSIDVPQEATPEEVVNGVNNVEITSEAAFNTVVDLIAELPEEKKAEIAAETVVALYTFDNTVTFADEASAYVLDTPALNGYAVEVVEPVSLFALEMDDGKEYDIKITKDGNEVETTPVPVLVRLPANGEVSSVLLEKVGGTIFELDFTQDGGFVMFGTTNAGKVSVITKADAISVQFEQVEEGLYNINLVANNGSVINRLLSADLEFVLTSDKDMAYEILPVAPVKVHSEKEGRYMFNFDGVTQPDDTDSVIRIAQVEFTGYSEFEFKVVENNGTNVVSATEADDSIVEHFYENAGLIVNDAANNGIIDSEVKVPTKKLTINVDFPNTVEGNAYNYQKMLVKISGEDIETIEYKLGDDVALVGDKYTIVVEDKLTLNTSYAVEVSGEGYRTARYTVNMNDEKVLNFWNNVKDVAIEVEEGKSASAKAVTFLAGDIVKDANINVYDLSAVVSYFGTINLKTAIDADKYIKYDLNRDGKIDSKDVAYVLVSWGK